MTVPLIVLRTNHILRQLSDTFLGHVFEAEKDIVLITGGCNGLGKELVKYFEKSGTKVVVIDVDSPSEEEQNLENVYYFRCDITDKDKLLDIKEIVTREIGVVSVLINNAGIMRGKSLLDLSFEDIDKTIQVNLLANFYLVKIFLPGMLAIKRGYVVTIASVLGYMSPALLSAYGASKSGVIALHESLTYELGPPSFSKSGVKTLLVAPGQLRTEMFKGVQTPSQLLAPKLEPSYVAKVIFNSLQLGRRGEIKVPFYGNFLPLFRALPWRVTELARYYSGIDSSMQTYKEQLVNLKHRASSIASFATNPSSPVRSTQ